ncbi:MAG TPA: hypothetical protein VF240_19085 [Pyrinomonadaceae bacterium]
MALKYVVFFPESDTGRNPLNFETWYITYKPHDGKTWHEGALLKSEIGAGREWLDIQKHGTLTIAIGGAYDAVIHKLLSLQASRAYFTLVVTLQRGPAAKGAPTRIKSEKRSFVALYILNTVEVITLVPKKPGFYFINLRLRGDMKEVLVGEERAGADLFTVNDISEFDAEGRKRW